MTAETMVKRSIDEARTEVHINEVGVETTTSAATTEASLMVRALLYIVLTPQCNWLV